MWYILPITNDLYTIIIGFIYRFGQFMNSSNLSNVNSLGHKFTVITNSNYVGDIWLVLFICTCALGIGSYVYAYFSKNKGFNYVSVSCIVSIIISLVVVYYFFS